MLKSRAVVTTFRNQGLEVRPLKGLIMPMSIWRFGLAAIEYGSIIARALDAINKRWAARVLTVIASGAKQSLLPPGRLLQGFALRNDNEETAALSKRHTP